MCPTFGSLVSVARLQEVQASFDSDEIKFGVIVGQVVEV